MSAQITVSADTAICGGFVTLEVLSAGSYGTAAYTVDSFPATSETHAGTNAFPTGTDDISTSAIDMGFEFCFFGNAYTDCYISTNGWVTFTNPPSAWNTVYGPGGSPSYSVPNTNTNVPKNCIMGPWQDWNPYGAGSLVKYQTLGTAPYRRFVASFQDMPLFSCSSSEGSFQIVLYETTNIIENHIIDKPNCTSWESGKATMAIHNSGGTVSYEVSGRDASAWTTSDESWRYTPAGIEWYVGATLVGTGDSITVSPTSTTTYTASLVGCDGTTYSADVTVTVSAPDDATFSYPGGSGTTHCADGTILSPDYIATSGGTFSATPAGLDIDAATGDIDLGTSTAGTYTIEYLTNGTCPDSSTVSITISDFDDATFSYATDTYCPTGTAYPSYTATSGGTFSISPTDMTINASTGMLDLSTATVGTTYTITYTTTGTCPSISTFDVTIEPTEDATFSYDASSYCPTGSTIPTISGTTGGTFTVTPATITISSTTGELDLTTGDVGTTYTITYTTPGYCTESSTETVLIDPLDDPTFSYSAASFCPTGTEIPTITGVTGGTFSVSPTGLVIDAATGEVDLSTGTVGTVYAITYTTPAGPCQNEATETILIDPLDDPAFNYSAASYCVGGSTTPIAITTAGGTFTISPTDASINALTGTIDLSTGTPGTTYTITYTTPTGPCQNSSTQTVTILPTTVADFTYSPTSYCSQGTILPTSVSFPGGTFSADAGLVIDATTGEINLDASSVGTFTVSYTSPGCGETQSVDITIFADPVLTIDLADVVCLEGNAVPIIVTPTGGVISGEGVSGSLFDPGLAGSDGVYTVFYSYTDANGCTGTVSTTIEVIQNIVDAGPDVSIYEAGEIQLNAEGGSTFTWSPDINLSCTGCASPVASPAETITYTVTSYDVFGCVATDDVTVTVIPVFDSTVFVPNTFTPNGDGVNDFLFAFGSDIVLIKSFNIFDRWGELIWSREALFPMDITFGWDGYARGLPVTSGVYAFTLEAELNNGVIIFKKGNVTVLR
ncbi:MAG: gliding motility-associated C-terminal domain-containing protein [Chitinophagales bacterium]